MSDSMNQKDFDLVEIPEEQVRLAAATAYRHAESEEEALLFWQILGIIPTTVRPTCTRCGSVLKSDSVKIWREQRGGLCHACYRKDLKARKAVES